MTPPQVHGALALAGIVEQAPHERKIFVDDELEREIGVRVEVLGGATGHALDRGSDVLARAVGPQTKTVDQLIGAQSFGGALESFEEIGVGKARRQHVIFAARDTFGRTFVCKTKTDMGRVR